MMPPAGPSGRLTSAGKLTKLCNALLCFQGVVIVCLVIASLGGMHVVAYLMSLDLLCRCCSVTVRLDHVHALLHGSHLHLQQPGQILQQQEAAVLVPVALLPSLGLAPAQQAQGQQSLPKPCHALLLVVGVCYGSVIKTSTV